MEWNGNQTSQILRNKQGIPTTMDSSSNPVLLHLLIHSQNPSSSSSSTPHNHHPPLAPPDHHLTKKSLPNPSSTTAFVAATAIRFPIAAAPGRSSRRAMENITALAIKLATSDPDRPLTAARKALIEKRLSDFFPDFHTPNHPTYAAMINRAIVELKEPEGSSEESISEFIRKQYDDLPRAHFTLLKHHLQKLCESGEIVVTSDKRYLLADGIISHNSGPYSSCQRELMPRKQKRRGKKLRGRARRRRKVQIKEQNQPAGEQMEGQDQVKEQRNLVIEEQNVTEEPHSDLIEELNVLWALEQEQQSVLIEEQNQLEGQVMDSKHLEQNQTEFPSPERPPGFNLMKVKELFKLQEQQLSDRQQKNPKLQLDTMTTSIGLSMSVKPLRVEQQHEHPYPVEPPVTSVDLAADPQLVEQEQQPDFSYSGRPLELCAQQKACKFLPMTPTTSLTLPTNSEPRERCKLELPNSGRILEVKMMTKGKGEEFSHTLQHILEEQRQLRHQNRRQSEHKKLMTEAMMQLFPLKHRQELEQHSQISGLEGLQVLKSVEKLPEMQLQQQEGKKHGKKKQAKPRPETIITQDVPMNSSWQLEFSNTGRSPGPELATVVPSSEEQQQQGKLCEGQRTPRSEPETLTASLDSPESSEQQPNCSVPEKPVVLDLVTMEQASQTELFQQQVRQHGERKMTRSKSKTMRTQDLPVNSEQLADLPNPELCQRPEIRTVEPFSREEEQQAKLCEGQKASLLVAVTAALDLPKYPEQQAEVSVPESPIELNLATMDQSSQTERMRRQLRRWDQRTSASKPPSTSVTELLPSEFQYQEPELPNEESPPVLKQTPVEESTQKTEQQAKLCGRQKRIKSQPKIITDSLNMPLAPQKLERQQQPELPSPERAQKQQCKQKQEKPQHRQLRPRPPKPEQATATTMGQHQHEQQQQKLPNKGILQELKQKPAEESTQRGRKKPKLNVLQKLSEQETRTGSLDSLLALRWKPEQQPVFPSPKRAKKQQEKQAQENPQCMKLQTRCPKSESTAATTTAELVPVQDQHEEQQQLDYQDGGRPLEKKSDMTSSVVESSPLDHQNQHEHPEPAARDCGRPRKLHNSQQQQEQTEDIGRGRHPKHKSDDTTMQNVFPSEEKLQEPKSRGWERPRKLDKVK